MTEKSPARFHLGGTVRHVELEGGLFVIDAPTATDTSDQPSADYQIDGLALEAEARRRHDMALIAMVARLLELLRIRRRLPEPLGGGLPVGTTWRLEDFAGTAVLDSTAPTLEFPAEGQVAGWGSCDRSTGPL